MSKIAYENARTLAKAWAIHGPGTFSIAGEALEAPLNDLLSVFKNSVPRNLRAAVAERVSARDWLGEDEIAARLNDALVTLANSEELKAAAPNMTADDLAFLEVAAGLAQGANIANAAWMVEAASAAQAEDIALRDALADAAIKAQAFIDALGADVDQIPGGDAQPLRAAVDDLTSHLEVAAPFAGARIRRLEPAADAAQRALTRYAHDGRMMVEMADTGSAPALTQAKELEVALDTLGYEIPNAIWMDHPARIAGGEIVTRADVQSAVHGSLVLLETIHNHLEIVDPEMKRRKELLENTLSAAGYLLPGESETRDLSVAAQEARGTDDQLLAILGSSAEFCRALEMGNGLRRGARVNSDGLIRDASIVAGPAVEALAQAVAKTGVTTAARAIDASIVDGRRDFHFAFISRAALERNVEGMMPGYSEAEGRRVADLMADSAPDLYQESVQWVSVAAENDIEAVARYNRLLNDQGFKRDDVVTVLADGIPTARLEDIEFGRAEGILAENSAAIAFTKGEAELVMQLVEAVDKIVDKAYQHPESYEDAAFPVRLAADAVDAARRVETETGVRPMLAAIAAGKREAAGFSREGADAMDKFLGASIDAMKSVLAQDDYVMKVKDSGAQTERVRGLDETASFEDEGHAIDDDGDISDATESAAPKAEKKKIHGQTMWEGWADRMKDSSFVKRNFIAALSGNHMTRLIGAHERIGAKGLPMAIAAMAGREGAPSLSALALGVDPRGYASMQEAMGMGMGGRDGKTKASLMEDRVINELEKPKMEMGWADWNVLPDKAKEKVNPYFMETKVDGHLFPMQRPAGKKANEPEFMKKAWTKDLDVIGTGRGDFDAERRRLMTSLARIMKNADGTPNRDFMTFLTRIEGRPIVAPTRNAAEALREVSNGYIRQLEDARHKASEKIQQARAERMADTKFSAFIDRAEAERLLQVWEGAGSKTADAKSADATTGGMPVVIKKGDGLAIVHPDLPTAFARPSDDKPIQALREGHNITVVDMAALKAGLGKTPAAGGIDRFELKLEGYRITAYGNHELVEPKKTLAAAGARIKDSELVI